MISQTAEYALRAMVYLADQNSEPHTTAQIAEAAGIPAGYLAKVMQSLGRANLVRSQRGLKGGFVLMRDAKEISLLDVVNAVDPVRRFHRCPLDVPAHHDELCLLHHCLDEAAQAVERTFGSTSIGQMLEVPESRKPLCTFPRKVDKSPETPQFPAEN
jgi:Rrf2 family transcriptional regulator, nitric oxide-sensitive transcriptional repressor